MKWNKRAPPAAGWWPASATRDPGVWRWWNGACWSGPVRNGDGQRVLNAQLRVADTRSYIEWRDWPKEMRHLPSYPLATTQTTTEPTND